MPHLILVQQLEKPVQGWWDGGPQSRFKWKIDGTPMKDGHGEFIRVGSWGANRWFNVAIGDTDKQTLGNARRRLGAFAKKAGIKCTFSYEVR